MNEISPVTTSPQTVQLKKNINFRAATAPSSNTYDEFISQREKEKKAAKRKENAYYTFLGISALCSIGILGFFAHQAGLFGKKVQKAITMDLTNKKSLKDLALGETLQKQTDEIKLQWERAGILKEKGQKAMSPIFLYSEPGTGKNAWVYGLCKDTGTELFETNVLKFNDKFFGESENNILKFIDNVIKKAEKEPNKKFAVYFDEIDSVARKDMSSNAAHSEKLQNAFKTGFNKLLEVPNIQIIASSNKACKEEAVTALLDEAIINRFGKKIFVPLPNSQQLQNCFLIEYKKLPDKYVSKELLDVNNPTIKKMCDYLSQDGHHISFRDAEDIIAHARVLSEMGKTEGSPITLENLKQAVIEKADQLNWPPAEIQNFIKTIA